MFRFKHSGPHWRILLGMYEIVSYLPTCKRLSNQVGARLQTAYVALTNSTENADSFACEAMIFSTCLYPLRNMGHTIFVKATQVWLNLLARSKSSASRRCTANNTDSRFYNSAKAESSHIIYWRIGLGPMKEHSCFIFNLQRENVIIGGSVFKEWRHHYRFALSLRIRRAIFFCGVRGRIIYDESDIISPIHCDYICPYTPTNSHKSYKSINNLS